MSAKRLSVVPTRIELLKLKSRKELAEAIAEILKKELEVLINSMFQYREKAITLQTQLFETLSNSYGKFIEAELVSGSRKVKEFALTTNPNIFNVEKKKVTGVLGLPFPSLKLIKQDGNVQKHSRSLNDAPIQLEEATSKFSRLMDSIVELANLIAILREIIELILTRRRQINGVQFRKIPQLSTTIKFVENILGELEQQDAIRVRVLQRKRKEKAEKSYETQ
ncbi:MAG: V-type ATP synthase subunit D [Promethearchaeota archaeon]